MVGEVKAGPRTLVQVRRAFDHRAGDQFASAPNSADPSLAAEPSEELHTRVPREMRDALRASVRRQGVSLSKVVEQWLAAGMNVLHDGDIPANVPSLIAVLHPSCFFGEAKIQMEYDQARSACKVTIDMHRPRASAAGRRRT